MDNHEEIKGISVNVTDEEDCRKVLNIEVEMDLLEKEKEKVLSEIVKDATIPGFRKGKAPRDMVKKKFGGDIHTEAIKNVLPKAYGHALHTEQIHPIGDPVFRDIDGGIDSTLTFRVDVETAPMIELKEYKGLSLEPEKAEVTAEEIDRVIENLREREVDFTEVEREATTEDMVVIDYVPVGEDGEPDVEKKMEDYPVQL
ncbi:MAG TPA: trigger factor, partial [Candidatus Krumholzibacterium sp.]|nr:trigger factor [Candidatus Krumholzibacterium sp.]